jgi:hypothetical protein
MGADFKKEKPQPDRLRLFAERMFVSEPQARRYNNSNKSNKVLCQGVGLTLSNLV